MFEIGKKVVVLHGHFFSGKEGVVLKEEDDKCHVEFETTVKVKGSISRYSMPIDKTFLVEVEDV